MNRLYQNLGLIIALNVCLISHATFSAESEYTFYPPYSDPYNTIGDQYCHIEHILGEKGHNYAFSDCSGDLDTGLIKHNIACESYSYVWESYVRKTVTDNFRRTFTVPNDGQYEITFNGIISGDYYELATSLLGAGKGKSRFWLDGGVNYQVLGQRLLYETDLSLRAYLSDVIMEVIWATLGARAKEAGSIVDLAQYFGDLSGLVDPVASWPPKPTNFSITCNTSLLTNTKYIWDFWVNSDITSHSVLFMTLQNTSLESYITLQSVKIKYLGQIPANQPPTLYDQGYIADPTGPDLYPHTEFEFYVHYDDPEEYIPQMVSVKIDGVLYPMHQDAGDRYACDITGLSANTHIYSFYAVDKQGATFETPSKFLIIKEFNEGSFDFIGTVKINDSKDIYSGNNNDGMIQSGEIVAIRPEINYSDEASETATHIDVSLISKNPYMEEVNSPENYPDMVPGMKSEPDVDEYFKVNVDKTCEGELYLDSAVEWRGQDGKDRNVYIYDAILLNVQREAWINITPDEYDFGAVKPRPENDVTMTCVVQNIGSEILNVSDILTSHTDTDITPKVFSVSPGHSVNVVVTVHVSTLEGLITRVVSVIHDGRAKRYSDDHLTITGLVSNTSPVYEIPTIGRPNEPDISGSKIVWSEDRNGDGKGEIHLHDVNSGKQRLVVPSDHYQGSAFVSGNLIIFKDSRSWDGIDSWYDQSTIVGYDLSTEKEFIISAEPSYQKPVGVSGNLIAIQKPYQTLETNHDVATNLIVYEYLGNGQVVQKYSTGYTPIGGTGDRPSVMSGVDFNNGMLVFIIGNIEWGGTGSSGANSLYKIDFAAGDTNKSSVNNPSGTHVFAAGLHNLVFQNTDPVSNDEHIYLWPGNKKLTPDTDDDYAYDYLAFNGTKVIYNKSSFPNIMYSRDLNPDSEKLVTNLLSTKNETRMDANGIVWEQLYSDGSWHINFTYLDQAEISVSSSNIIFSNNNPVEGDTINVTVKIQNSADYSITEDITVKLFDGDPDLNGIQLGTDYVISGGMIAQSEISYSFSAIPVGVEGEHQIYVKIYVAGHGIYANNKASKSLIVGDAHLIPPKIIDVLITEYNGDGDGLVESNEKVKIQWRAIPQSPLNIASTYCQIADIKYVGEGSYYIILNPLADGDYSFIIYAEDNDLSPESDTYEGNFSVSHLAGDITGDGKVNMDDFDSFGRHWLDKDCLESGWCEKADINKSGNVDISDLAILAKHWLYGTEIFDNSIIGYWDFNEGSGDIIHDKSRNNYVGTLFNGTAWTDGVSGKALQFDGLDDYVSVPFGTGYEFTNGLTIQAWIKTTETDAGPIVVSREDWNYLALTTGPTNPDNPQMQMAGFHLFLANGDYRVIDSPNPVNDGKWHHIVGTYNNTEISLYVDGIKYSKAASGVVHSSANFDIGRDNTRLNEPGRRFNGTIDEVRIYDRPLSSQEITDLYEADKPNPTITEGLIAYYKLDDVTGSVKDEIGVYQGVNNGATTGVSGVSGTAYEFDGSDYISTDLIPSIYTTTSMWIYPKGAGSFMGTGYTTNGGKDGWGWYYNSADKKVNLYFYKGNAALADGTIQTPNDSVPLNSWSNVTVIVNNMDVSIFVNGALSTTGALPSSPDTHDRGLMIGRNFQSGGGANTMPGLIDEVRIYNRVLTAAEVQALYQNP